MPDISTLSNIEKVLNAFGEKVTGLLGEGLPPEKNASGKLRQSIHFSLTHFGFKYNFQITMEDYYKFVDEGRRAGAPPPPVSNIIQWIRDKKLIINNGTLQVRKFQTKKVHLLADGANVTSMAYAISRSIAKKGIKPVPFFTNATKPEIWQQLQADLSAAAGRDITIEIREGLKDINNNV